MRLKAIFNGLATNSVNGNKPTVSFEQTEDGGLVVAVLDMGVVLSEEQFEELRNFFSLIKK